LLADGPVLDAIMSAAEELAGDFPGTPVKVIAAAIADILAAPTLREDIARVLLVQAQIDAGDGEWVAVRKQAAALLGTTYQGVERRFALVGRTSQGRDEYRAAALVQKLTAGR
jgi:hypothetical protein